SASFSPTRLARSPMSRLPWIESLRDVAGLSDLLDDGVVGGLPNELGVVLRLRVIGEVDEVGRMCPDLLVLRDRQKHDAAALRIGAFADERERAGDVVLLGRVFDPLVRLAVDGVVPRNLVGIHRPSFTPLLLPLTHSDRSLRCPSAPRSRTCRSRKAS